MTREPALAIGDRVTVQACPADPVRIIVNPHAVIRRIEENADGHRYFVGHPPVPDEFGPYLPTRLIKGWVDR